MSNNMTTNAAEARALDMATVERCAKVADAAAQANLARSDELKKSVDLIDIEYSVAFHRKHREAASIANDIRALAAAPTIPATGEVSGWIVGNNIGQWRTFDSFGWAWTDRRDLAVRYARREDAELVHGDDEDSWRVEQYPASITIPDTGHAATEGNT